MIIIILIGKATRLFEKIVNQEKEYKATLKLGETTSTGDQEGEVIKTGEYRSLQKEQIKRVFANFVGSLEQTPPLYSALKYKGERLYRLARRGEKVVLTPRQVKIYKCQIEQIKLPFVDFIVCCSKGTYIRQLAVDIGEQLNCGAHLVKLCRTRIGAWGLQQAIDLDKVEINKIIKIDDVIL